MFETGGSPIVTCHSADSELDGRQVQEHGETLFLEREARHFSVT